jgi:DNA-binding MarR family transcriptional regulator
MSLHMSADRADERFEAGIDFELIEMLFFAYRDFVGEPDRVLSRDGLGRAHHRVLHFVSRNPGLTIAALLDILQITKQSLARVLRDLVEAGLIEQSAGASDRRQRHLHCTVAGTALMVELASLQQRRIEKALKGLGPAERLAVLRFLTGLRDQPSAPRRAALDMLDG